MLYQTLVSIATSAALIMGITTPSAGLTELSKITEPVVVDTRAAHIDLYFSKRDMPLAGYGKKMVSEADTCGLDWRLVAAIGVRESSGGKRLMNNNPFGWGSAKIRFKDFNEAIEVVTYNLCGINPNTARYYADNDTLEKLHWFNGTVMPTYPAEVVGIMNHIERTDLNT